LVQSRTYVCIIICNLINLNLFFHPVVVSAVVVVVAAAVDLVVIVAVAVVGGGVVMKIVFRYSENDLPGRQPPTFEIIDMMPGGHEKREGSKSVEPKWTVYVLA